MACILWRGVAPLGCVAVVASVVLPSVGVGEVIAPFNGKTLDGWAVREPRERNRWVVAVARLDPQDPTGLAVSAASDGKGELVNATTWRRGSKEKRDVDLYTVQTFGDCTIELEFMIPEGANSGVYVMGAYEIQIKDSFGVESLTFQDLGAIYKVAPARVNAARKAGQWQSLRIEFVAPRFEGEKKVANARFVKVLLNGQVIHENVELTNVTPGGLTGKEVSTGPLMFQGDHGPVAFRNIRITLPTTR